MHRRGFLALFGLAAAAPALALDELAQPPVAGAVELGVAPAAETAGFLVPADFLVDWTAVLKSAAMPAVLGSPPGRSVDFEPAAEHDWIDDRA